MIRGTEHHDRLVEGEWLQKIRKKIKEVMTEMHRKNRHYRQLCYQMGRCKEREALSCKYLARFRIRICINLSCWIRIHEGKNDPLK